MGLPDLATDFELTEGHALQLQRPESGQIGDRLVTRREEGIDVGVDGGCAKPLEPRRRRSLDGRSGHDRRRNVWFLTGASWGGKLS